MSEFVVREIFGKQIRLDSEGRDVTDLPGLWDESDTFVSELDQPFTVEWLVEIGGVDRGGSIAFRCGDGGLLLEVFTSSAGSGEWWLYNTIEIPMERRPKNRRDVLKWLDVLGIVPATKGVI